MTDPGTLRSTRVPTDVAQGTSSVATSAPFRCIRGATVGLVAFTLAGLGHLCAGGQIGGASGAVAALGSVGLATALSGRRWRAPSLFAFLACAQLAFHVCFASSQTMSPVAGSSMAMHQMGSSGPAMTAAMVAAHLVAAACTTVVLRRGEDWCWVLLDLLLAPWHGTPAVALPPLPQRRPVSHRVPVPAGLARLAAAVVRRGPPALLEADHASARRRVGPGAPHCLMTAAQTVARPRLARTRALTPAGLRASSPRATSREKSDP